jgi:hypothetical protein
MRNLKFSVIDGVQHITMQELMAFLPSKDRARIHSIDKTGRIILKYAGDQGRISALLERAAEAPLYGVFYGSVTDAIPGFG